MAGLVPVAGLLRDAQDSPSAPLVFGAVMMLLSAVSLLGFRVVQRRQALVSPAASAASALIEGSDASYSTIPPTLLARADEVIE